MSNLYRILLFVPPLFLFLFPATGQLTGTIELNSSTGTYTVSAVPSVTWTQSQSTLISGVLTLTANTQTFQVANFQSLTGSWSIVGPMVAPSESPNSDYVSFLLQQPVTTVTFNSGVPIPLFSFKNNLPCTQISLIDEADPFNVEPNSFNIGVANSFTVLGAGPGVNAYSGNSNLASFVPCAPLSAIASATENPLPCNGEVTDITLTISGGQEPYQVQVTNTTTGATTTVQINTFEGSTTFSNMPAGAYTFHVLDAQSSTYDMGFQLQQPFPLEIEMLAFPASCNGSSDGQVQVEDIDGGTWPFSFTWSGLAATDSVVNFLNPGEYFVTVTDNNGCTATSSTIIESFAVIYPNPIVKDIVCNGAANGIIDLYPVSPNPPFTYNWSSNVTTGDFSSAWMLGPGTYSVTITDDSGCSEDFTYSIAEPLPLELDYIVTEPICFGDKGSLEVIGVSNSQGNWEASIVGGPSIKDGSKFDLEPGIPLKLVVEDEKGCTIEEDFIVSARQELHLEIGNGQNIKYGEEVQIEAEHFPFNNVRFEWSPAEGLSCTDCPDPIAIPTESTTYRLTMTDSAGCSVSDQINFAVRKSRDIYIPNAFSPNQDGINDVFYPYGGFEIVEIKSMMVFDRWGGKMFESTEPFKPNDPNVGWKGMGAKADKPAITGTYLYTMNVEFIDGEVVMFSGEVNLVK